MPSVVWVSIANNSYHFSCNGKLCLELSNIILSYPLNSLLSVFPCNWGENSVGMWQILDLNADPSDSRGCLLPPELDNHTKRTAGGAPQVPCGDVKLCWWTSSGADMRNCWASRIKEGKLSFRNSVLRESHTWDAKTWDGGWGPAMLDSAVMPRLYGSVAGPCKRRLKKWNVATLNEKYLGQWLYGTYFLQILMSLNEVKPRF